MKTHRLPLLVLTVLLGARLSAQDIPANDVAQALDDLKTATLNKIDGEIEINARAFADAQNIQNSLFWNDLFRPFMDIAMGVYDGLTDLPTKRPDSVRAWMKTTLQGANAAKSFFSVLGSFDRLIQDGENLELTLDGPAYNGLVTAMLDRASATGSHLLFDYQAYKQSVMNDLYGAAPVNSPFRVAHKSIAVDRSGGGSFDSVLAARTYIAGQFTSLSSQMRATSLPPARIAEMVSFLRARRQDVLQSRIGQTSVTYEAYLLNGPTLVKRQVTYSLGTIGQLEQWRGTMLDAFVRNLGYDMIGISVRVAEKAGEFVTDSLVDDAFKTVNLNLSVEAVVAGQQEANLVLKEASSLGMAVLKPDVGDLADRLQSYVSSSREQINMTPESMMDAFPGEVSKVLLLVDDAIKFTQTLAASPNVTSITPNILTAVALPQTQALTIIGTGFTTGSRLNFLYGTIEFTDRLPSFTSATELHYDIGIGERPGNWTAKVVNGVQESDPFSLIVVPPPTPGSGSLSVTLQPSGAVAAGAQWRVDSGSYRNHGDTATGLTPGSHTVSFKTVTGYTAPTDHTVTITAGTAASDSGNYTPIAAATYALTLSPGGSMGSSTPSPVGTMNGGALVYTAGTLVQLTANANLGYHFVGWGGDLTGTANPTSLTMNGNKSVTANFASGDPNMGTIIVTLLPSAAAAAGVTWGFNSSDFRASGSSYTTWPATYALSLHPVDGWLAPPALVATITAGQTANYSATFTADTTPGLLTVTLTPPGAVAAGAKWRVNGGAPQGNGSTLSLSPGTDYTISFDPVSGWTPPANQTVTVRRAQTTATAGNYVPPAGRPVIASVSPPVGPLAGGTLLTINGVNFSAPVGVTVGGQPATGVNLASPTSVTCLTPPSSVYGTTNVIVETVGGRATNVSGFTYGIPRGSGFDLMNSFGGRSYGIWVQGNYAYVGEGKSLLVMDVSVPANPWRIGRVQLPGTVRGIAVSGQYAYVASSEGGLQVVDISAPAAPIVRGFYPTSSWTDGVAVLGGRAYVADEGVGLEILDVSNPAMPTLVASTNCGGTAVDIVVKGSANGVFAYLSTGGQVCVLDVSDPSIPVLRGTCSIDYIGSLAVSGTRVFAASIITGLHMVDVSNPDAPRDLGTASGTFTPRAVATANNVIYAIDNDPSYGFYIYTINGTALTLVGHTTGVGSSGTHMMVSGNRAFIAGGTSGFEIVDVSNPAGPSALGRFTDSGLFGQYGPVTAFGLTSTQRTTEGFGW